MNPVPVHVLATESCEDLEKAERGLWVATVCDGNRELAVVVLGSTKVESVRLSLLRVSPEWIASDGLPSGALVSVSRRPL